MARRPIRANPAARAAPALLALLAPLVLGLPPQAAADAAAEGAVPLYDAGDVAFLQHMIVHHEQALELSALVPGRSDRAAFHRFARNVDSAQRAEIAQMRGLLEAAAQRGLAVPQVHLHGDPPMHGMLSRAQMAAIAGARGERFERLWLEGMIVHHQGAVDMALAQQQRQFAAGRRPFGIDQLADEIIAAQRAEISMMRHWLTDWGLAPR